MLCIIGQDERHSAVDLILQYIPTQAAFLPLAWNALRCLETTAKTVTDSMMNKLPVNQ